RAPTPSIAAELSVPDLAAELRKLRESQARLDGLLTARVSDLRSRVGRLHASLESHSPVARLRHDRSRVLALQASLAGSVRHATALRRERLRGLEAQLA